MRVLVTGSSGHLGEALMRMLAAEGHSAIGLDRIAGPFTDVIAEITDAAAVGRCVAEVEVVLHAATLHKPHVATHSTQAFVDTNVSGTLTLLEAAAAAGLRGLVFTSTTSAFGASLRPAPGAPAVWIDERVPDVPKNIYGATKTAAEGLCHLFHRTRGLPCLVLRTSRFFPEEDDRRAAREAFADANLKANEFLHRRVDLEDAARAHLDGMARLGGLDFRRYVISAATPFWPEDRAGLRRDAPAVVERRVPGCAAIYAARGFRLPPMIERVYDSARARAALGWQPKYDFARVLGQLERGEPIGSDLARAVGRKGYHGEAFEDGPYPVDPAEGG